MRARGRGLSAAAAVGVALATAGVGPSARAAEPDPWWGRDKALHFAATASIAGAGYGGAAFFTDRRAGRMVAGASLAMVAGIGKELWDLTGRGDASWKDLTWDAVGTATGVLTARAVDWLTCRWWCASPAR